MMIMTDYLPLFLVSLLHIRHHDTACPPPTRLDPNITIKIATTVSSGPAPRRDARGRRRASSFLLSLCSIALRAPPLHLAMELARTSHEMIVKALSAVPDTTVSHRESETARIAARARRRRDALGRPIPTFLATSNAISVEVYGCRGGNQAVESSTARVVPRHAHLHAPTHEKRLLRRAPRTTARTPFSAKYGARNGGGCGHAGLKRGASTARPGGAGDRVLHPPFGGEVGCGRGQTTSPRQYVARRRLDGSAARVSTARIGTEAGCPRPAGSAHRWGFQRPEHHLDVTSTWHRRESACWPYFTPAASELLTTYSALYETYLIARGSPSSPRSTPRWSDEATWLPSNAHSSVCRCARRPGSTRPAAKRCTRR